MRRLTIKTEDLRLQQLEKIRQLSPEKLYIWGSGSYSRSVSEYLHSVGQYTGKICFVVDDAYYLPRDNTISFSEYLALNDKETPVVFGFYNYPIIQNKIAEWKDEIPHLYDFHLTVVNGHVLAWDAYLAKSREEEYRRTYALLSDDRSRTAMERYLNAATAGEFYDLFTQCYEKEDYFNRITENLKIDTLVDCGAFDGDSIHDFIEVFPAFKKIIAVEPDPLNALTLREREEREGIHNLFVIQKGLGSQKGQLRFQVNGESNSFLSDSGDLQVDITTLDDIFSCLSGDLGKIFVKMDIEGSELDALHGAKRLIQEQKPALAICVYHKEEDLIKIPQFIYGIAGERTYDYYLGFHGLDLAELVFYAIPKSYVEKENRS